MIVRLSQLFLLLASAVSCWLAWVSLSDSGVAGCGGAAGTGCDPVLSSHWARIGPLPVSLLGAACYALTLVASFCKTPRLMRLGAAIILLAAVWFMGLQIFHLQHLCWWCSACHTLAGIAALGLLAGACSWRLEAVAALLAVGGLAAWQAFHRSSDGGRGSQSSSQTGTLPHSTAGKWIVIQSAEQIRLLESPLTISSHQLPELGRARWFPTDILVQQPELTAVATQPVLVLGDWGCEHCRVLHQRLSSTFAQESAAPANVSLLFIPVSLTADAREMHRLMLTAWFADRAAYSQLGDQISREEVVATPAAISTALHNHFTQARWAQIEPVYATAVENLLKLGDAIYAAAAKRAPIVSLPMLITPHELTVGEVTVEELRALLQRTQTGQKADIQAVQQERHPGKGRIEFEQTRVESPPVAAGAPARITWHFRNTGTEPLSLLAVQTGCGCAVAEDWQKTVAPGSSGSFSVIYDAKGRQIGPNQYTVLLITNAANGRPQDQGTELQAIVTALPPDK
ncbi:MAG: DUF1573 domain-containing protein [Verrucomicrobiaceae bacterium]|nr:DUF1573 domain-containing protein [Verrucomicrobiaceae bacterium]